MDPITLSVLAASGAAMAKHYTEVQALKQEGKNADLNERLTQRGLDDQAREAHAATAQAMTDRMREAARNMSMARVLGAEGVADADARIFNVVSGESEDVSRITESGKAHVRQIGDQKLATNRQTRQIMKSIKDRGTASAVNMVFSIGAAAAQGAAMKSSNAAQQSAAKTGQPGLTYKPSLTNVGAVKPDNFWYTKP